jgi:hypothetical protein
MNNMCLDSKRNEIQKQRKVFTVGHKGHSFPL